MKRNWSILLVVAFVTLLFIPSYVMAGNPCAAKNACNPCAANPCAAKNACNPCAANPCAAMNACNPCAANPCAAKVKPIRPDKFSSLKDAVNYGKKLWNDKNLGNSGLSCGTCHNGGKAFRKSALLPYPHFVKMPNDVVSLDQMINFCMLNPMQAKPLPYNSKEMTALSAYFQNVSVKEIQINPCAANPCAANPCAANPCAANPCAANPCAVKNACNPCAANPCAGR